MNLNKKLDPSTLPVSKLIMQFSNANDDKTPHIPKNKRRSTLKLRTVGKMVNIWSTCKNDNNNNITTTTKIEEENEEKRQKVGKLKSTFLNSTPILRNETDDSNLDSGKENNYDSGGETNKTPNLNNNSNSNNHSNVQLKKNIYNNLKSNNKSILINEQFARSRCSTLDISSIKRPSMKNITKHSTIDESNISNSNLSTTKSQLSNLVDDRFAKYFGLNRTKTPESATQNKSSRRRSKSLPRNQTNNINNNTSKIDRKIDNNISKTENSRNQSVDVKMAKYFGLKSTRPTTPNGQQKLKLTGQPRRRSSTVGARSQPFKFEDFNITPHDLSTADDDFNKLILGASKKEKKNIFWLKSKKISLNFVLLPFI